MLLQHAAHVLANDTVVTLTARGANLLPPSVSWSGACAGASTTCTVTMSQARSVTASFNAF